MYCICITGDVYQSDMICFAIMRPDLTMDTSSDRIIFRVTAPSCGEFHPQRPVTRIFSVLFHRRLNKWLNKRSRRWRFETSLRSLWGHCNASILNITVRPTFHHPFKFWLSRGFTLTCHAYKMLIQPLRQSLGTINQGYIRFTWKWIYIYDAHIYICNSLPYPFR